MILVDASALIALLRGEPAGSLLPDILRTGDAKITASNVAEVVDVMLRVYHVAPDDLDDRLTPLLQAALPALAVGEREARMGGAIRAAKYHHQRARLSMADCLLMATAITHAAPIVTADAMLAGVAADVGIEVRSLNGTRRLGG